MRCCVKVLLADLRNNPNWIPSEDYSHQKERLSQCNEGDLVEVLKEEGEWSFVAVLEQLQWKDRSWKGYQGWLHSSEIELRTVSENRSFTKKIPKELLLKGCEPFIGLPYLWGGCSPRVEGKVASVDCSGLMYQLFKRQGRLIPRDAHDQYLAAQKIHTPMAGDLLFLRPLTAKRITHVMLLFDQEHFLEAPESGKKIRFLRIQFL